MNPLSATHRPGPECVELEGSESGSERSCPIPGDEPYVEWAGPPSRPTGQKCSAAVNSAILLWRERMLLGWMIAAGTLLTLLIALLTPNRYESSTRLMAPDMRGNASEALMAGLLSRTGGGLAGLGTNLLGVDNTGAVFIGVLNSRSVADQLVKRFDLKQVYHDRRDQDARADLAERTSISEDRKSQIITISVEDRDPRRAANLAAAYVDELNRLLVEVNTSSAHRERIFIEERLRVVKPELDSAAQQLSAFSSKNTTLDPKEQGKAMVGAVVTLQGELIANETELAGLQQIYSDNNVRVRSLQARIGELRHQLQELRGRGAQSVAGEGNERGDQGQGKDKDDEGDSMYPSFRRLPTLEVSYADLYREVKLRETIFETLTQQYEMAKIAEAKEIPSVKVLDPANLPEQKSAPHRLSMTLIGVLLSFVAGAVFVVGRAMWRQVDPNDPRKQLAAEILQDARPAYFRIQAGARRIRTKLRRRATEDERSSSDLEEGQHL
jgi:capsule polysaccharide export protein KpsE/RkpR